MVAAVLNRAAEIVTMEAPKALNLWNFPRFCPACGGLMEISIGNRPKAAYRQWGCAGCRKSMEEIYGV